MPRCWKRKHLVEHLGTSKSTALELLWMFTWETLTGSSTRKCCDNSRGMPSTTLFEVSVTSREHYSSDARDVHCCAAQTPHLLHEIQGSDPLPPCAHGVAVGACKSCLRLSFRCSRYSYDTSQAFLTGTYCSIVAVTCAKRVEYMLSIFEFPCYGKVQSCHV